MKMKRWLILLLAAYALITTVVATALLAAGPSMSEKLFQPLLVILISDKRERALADKLDNCHQSYPGAKAEMARRVLEAYEGGGCVEVEPDHHVLASMSPAACRQKRRSLDYPEWRHID